MDVTVKYHDETSLTVEEIVTQAQHNYGKNVTVRVTPDSFNPHDLIYFGLQQIMTHEQLGYLYNDKSEYQKLLARLRSETLYKVSEIIDQVIIDNEAKVA